MILITGAAGFIGSNIATALKKRSGHDLFGTDNIANTEKLPNIVAAELSDYLDKDDFMRKLENGKFDRKFSAVIHQGACSNTLEQDGRYLMKNNYEYTTKLFEHCQKEKIPFIYASSAAVYGNSQTFKEERKYENPLNFYAYSKFLFDQYVRYFWKKNGRYSSSPVVGLRYFNVYGPRENHKGGFASVVLSQYKELQSRGKIKLFGANAGYQDGMQMRDFVYVDDIVNVNLFFLNKTKCSGIFNVGTGTASSFNDIAVKLINNSNQIKGKKTLNLEEIISQNLLEYLPFPNTLKGRYQSFTRADIGALRKIGYNESFTDIANGMEDYIQWLNVQTSV